MSEIVIDREAAECFKRAYERKQRAKSEVEAASADAPAPSFAALADDYTETMLRFAGAIESGVVEA